MDITNHGSLWTVELTGLLDWTTRFTFDLNSSLSLASSPGLPGFQHSRASRFSREHWKAGSGLRTRLVYLPGRANYLPTCHTLPYWCQCRLERGEGLGMRMSRMLHSRVMRVSVSVLPLTAGWDYTYIMIQGLIALFGWTYKYRWAWLAFFFTEINGNVWRAGK